LQTMISLPIASSLILSGCAQYQQGITTNTVNDVSTRHRAGLLLDEEREGRKHFADGRYGLAELHFRKAVEDYPGNAAAWTGLAATYDQLRRFDLAIRAYKKAIDIEGRSAALLNNLGYHYMLQGRYALARKNFLAAAQLTPKDARIQTNLTVLETGQLPADQR
jgi:Flp pilus assembly protein TadD